MAGSTRVFVACGSTLGSVGIVAQFLACGSSGSSASGADASTVTDAAGQSADAGVGLFSDPAVPACPQGFVAATLVQGSIAGHPVSIQAGGASQLDPNDCYEVDDLIGDAGPVLWHAVALQSTGMLAEGQALALTGGSILTTPDDPAGTYCIYHTSTSL
jgi:hypothetical protein